MARKPRLHHPSAFYHVMLRGNGGETIFFDNEDRESFLALLSECIQRFNFMIHGYCLMTNHVHLALQVGEVSLSKIMQNISFRYTRIINKKRKGIGHLFQGRFKALIVEADNYLLQLIQYIHLNPVRAKMVKIPEEHYCSSHRAYLKQEFIPWLTTSYVLNFFSTDDHIALSCYSKFISGDNQGFTINFDISMQKSFPAICDDGFMNHLKSIQENQKVQVKCSLEKIADLVCIYYGIKESILHEKSHKRENAKIRAIISWLAAEYKICPITKVANYFDRDISTLSRSLNRISSFYQHNELINIKEFVKNAIAQA